MRKQGGEPQADCKLRLLSPRARSRPLALCQTLACSLGRSSRPCTHGFFTARSDVCFRRRSLQRPGGGGLPRTLSRECGTQERKPLGPSESGNQGWWPPTPGHQVRVKAPFPEDPGAPETRSGAEGGREDGAHGRATQRELRDGAHQHRLWRTPRARRSV